MCYGHLGNACEYKNHPAFNKERCAWEKSVNGMKWKDKGKSKLPDRETLDVHN